MRPMGAAQPCSRGLVSSSVDARHARRGMMTSMGPEISFALRGGDFGLRSRTRSMERIWLAAALPGHCASTLRSEAGASGDLAAMALAARAARLMTTALPLIWSGGNRHVPLLRQGGSVADVCLLPSSGSLIAGWAIQLPEVGTIRSLARCCVVCSDGPNGFRERVGSADLRVTPPVLGRWRRALSSAPVSGTTGTGGGVFLAAP